MYKEVCSLGPQIAITGEVKSVGENCEIEIVHFTSHTINKLTACEIEPEKDWQLIDLSRENIDLITCPECRELAQDFLNQEDVA